MYASQCARKRPNVFGLIVETRRARTLRGQNQIWHSRLIERRLNSLCGHTCELRPVRPVGVSHDFEENVTGLTSITVALLVAEFIDDEQ